MVAADRPARHGRINRHAEGDEPADDEDARPQEEGDNDQPQDDVGQHPFTGYPAAPLEALPPRLQALQLLTNL